MDKHYLGNKFDSIKYWIYFATFFTWVWVAWLAIENNRDIKETQQLILEQNILIKEHVILQDSTSMKK